MLKGSGVSAYGMTFRERTWETSFLSACVTWAFMAARKASGLTRLAQPVPKSDQTARRSEFFTRGATTLTICPRPPARDAAEIQATKNAINHGLPIFVVLPGERAQTRRAVKLGWVSDFDDDNGQFLILFGEETPPSYSKAEAPSEPFRLMEAPRRKASTVMVRMGQQRFRFHVMSQYGHKCAVCEIRHPQLLKAAHICVKSEKGSDDWRNGIPLCATHHDAFDSHLFGIDPSSGAVGCKPGVTEKDIGISVTRLQPLKNAPHADALRWRWNLTQKEWNGHASDSDLTCASQMLVAPSA
jgi:HNH endonuclease